ncbi:hypothetical protein CTI12_AA340600 [Artemisia annua]|uniref:Helitron helicase-like domain-containing protein n=1 Tax=Artemisia annua TaxID=35608 RepID=A0A2U1MTN6_ARTAN|nr:hypothetical protein CTI12_AA340600 [Artemisia annua]
MPQQPITYATPSSDIGVILSSNSGNSIVSQRSVVCNTINNGNLGSFSPNSLPTSCNQTASVPATRKRQSPLDHISNAPVSLTPQQPKNVSTTPSSNMCNRAMTFGGSICKNEYTAAFNSSSSSGPSNSKHPIDRNIINEVREVLDTSSELVQTFRRARDRYTEDAEQNIKIKLIAKRGKDGRNYNLPTANEVAGLIYPLLMPRAQDGYHLNIPLRKKGKQMATDQRTTDKKDKNDKTVTMRQWFSYHIMDRPNQENLFTRGGRLFQQFLVDGYTMVETERLYFHRSKQSKLRSRGTTLWHWPEMPYPDETYITDFGNRLIHDETDYNPVELQSEYERLKKRVHGESSSRGEEDKGQEEELDINVLLQWLNDERKKKAAKEASIHLAKDEKEFSRSKALVAHEEDDSTDVSLDGLSYEEAHLAFDREKSPKLDD